MATDLQLYGRSILLESFENGLAIDEALKRVNQELGSNGMSDDEASEWYTEFANGNKGICKSASNANKKLIANGTFLPSQRASFANAYSDGHLRINLCRLNGTDGRFQVYYSHRKNYVVDTFHGTTRKIEYDWSEVDEKERENWCGFSLKNICFLNDNQVLGILSRDSFVSKLYAATFDFVDCKMVFKKTVKLPYCRRYWLCKTSILLHLYAEDSMQYAEINDDLMLVNLVDLPFKLYLSRIRDNKVCGFYYELGVIDVNKYVEFSLIDRTKKRVFD
ncbi:hypothetical protein M3Y94_00682600 [Aphelenchoides besseyi]|nr:hypothetical protein M3Y94_00682600 [Aphelenchoides besseyi]